MIQVVLTEGRRLFIPLERVVFIAENAEEELAITYINPEGKQSYAKISEFSILSSGDTIS